METFFLGLPPGVYSRVARVHLETSGPISVIAEGNYTFVASNKEVDFVYSSGLPIVAKDRVSSVIAGVYKCSICDRRDSLMGNFVALGNNYHINVYKATIVRGKTIATVHRLASMGVEMTHRVGNYSSSVSSELFLGRPHDVVITNTPVSNGAAILGSLMHGFSSKLVKDFCGYTIVSRHNRLSYLGDSRYFGTSVLSFCPGPCKVVATIEALSPSVVFYSRLKDRDRTGRILGNVTYKIGFVIATRTSDLGRLCLQRNAGGLLRDKLVSTTIFLSAKGGVKGVGRVFCFKTRSCRGYKPYSSVYNARPYKSGRNSSGGNRQRKNMFNGLGTRVRGSTSVMYVSSHQRSVERPS